MNCRSTPARPWRERCASPAIWLALWLVPVALLSASSAPATSSARSPSSSRRWRWSPSAAPTRFWPMSRSRPSRPMAGSSPARCSTGSGMAETTPGPLIMVLQFVGFMARLPRSRRLSPLLAGTLGGLLATWVTFVHASCGSSSVRPSSRVCAATGAARRALGDHGGGRRRHPQSRDLVCHPHCVPRNLACAHSALLVRRARAGERRSLGAAPLGRRDRRDVPVQSRHDPDARDLLGGWVALYVAGAILCPGGAPDQGRSVAHFDILHVRALR